MLIKQKIRDYLQNIPKNRVVTYKFLAQKYNTSPRAIARILSTNTQQDTYPCYKVICSDGSVGGYNLWVEEKIRRLERDGIHIQKGKINTQYLHNI